MIGIQLYTVRQLLGDEASCERTIRALKEMGYECAQIAGEMDEVERVAIACKRVGMPVIGILSGIEICETETQRLFAAARLCGAWDLGISEVMATQEEAEAEIKRINAFCKVATQEGFTFSYHNHSLEFIRCENGKTVMDMVCEGFEGDLMPDTYWIQHGGADVCDFIEKHQKKIKILHLKDMKRSRTGPTFAELGEGNMSMEKIVRCAKTCGIEHLIVEQDICDGDPLECARISFAYLDALRKKGVF